MVMIGKVLVFLVLCVAPSLVAVFVANADIHDGFLPWGRKHVAKWSHGSA
jgi:hypothetical protein